MENEQEKGRKRGCGREGRRKRGREAGRKRGLWGVVVWGRGERDPERERG